MGNSGGNGFNNDNPRENYGPLARDVRHILNLSGLLQLPLRFQLGIVVIYNSRPPFSAFLGSTQGGLDLNGDGTRGDLLPGTKVNQFNRSWGKEELRRLVDEFNRNYEGKQVVELRFFGGLSVEETAEVLKVSPATVMGDWQTAKAWLYREISKADR